MKNEEKISQAKAKLLVEYPYFGTLASKIALEINDDIESFKSDGKKIEYREEYLADLELSEIEFILANGAMHKALAHENRKGNRSGWLWQMATDIAINDMLIENGLEMPYGAEYRKRFAGMYAEEIYAELKDDILRDDEELEYEADDAEDVEQNQKEKTKEQLQEEILQEQLQGEEAIALLEQKFQSGEIPESIERFFDISHFGKIDWRNELRDTIDRYYRDDYTLIPPSKKLLYQGIYLPSNISNTFKLVIAIDSSGSIDEELLNEFLNEVNFLMEHLQNYQIDLLICDDKIHSHKTFYSGEILDVQIIGNGGTDFRPVFEFVEQNIDEVKLLLYFTDLDGIFPKNTPTYEVKWITTREKTPSFGQIILLN
ncbi:vWA domain-containing protein [Sulfurimonas sp.]|uniref:vWA domain-containing protein n=1 Tax=Sulfurimonas sp. TaxID=2022749 RepID=UPI003D0EADDA